MTLNEQQRKMLSRIANDSPMRGDGQAFLKLLQDLETEAAFQARAQESDALNRLMQGKSLGYEQLQKHFKDANK